jgi:hypothetical protein
MKRLALSFTVRDEKRELVTVSFGREHRTKHHPGSLGLGRDVDSTEAFRDLVKAIPAYQRGRAVPES